MENQRKCVLITGASSGIGKALAEEFSLQGFNLVLVARNIKKLNQVKSDLSSKYHNTIITYSADISEIDQLDILKDYIVENKIPVNILVNNAGAARYGEFENSSIEQQIQTINLNSTAIVKMTHIFLPLLKQNEGSKILNVASFAALYPLPYNSVYGATKSFVLSFSKAIRHELTQIGINVSCLCPGDTSTNFFKNAGNETSKRKLISPEIVARKTFKKLMRNKSVIFPKNVVFISISPKFFLENAIKKRMEKNRKLIDMPT